MQLYLALAIPIVLTTCWLYTAHISRASYPRIYGKSICLLIAHPDDEAMFFSPTLLALTEKDLGNHVKILCLSSGDADGLGETRKRELLKSASILGLRNQDDVLVIEDKAFPDSMHATWDVGKIVGILSSAFASEQALEKVTRRPIMGQTPSEKDVPRSTIDILITFDRQGVSSHPNHISLYHGAVSFLRTLMANKAGWECPVTLYTLTSVSIIRKYASVLDAPFTMLGLALSAGSASVKGKGRKGGMPNQLLYLSDLGQYFKAQGAMTRAHRSQMRWFRWGWIGIGRYMVVNNLRREYI
ncbi:MAG: N-acetylglucosaminyl-phosphatidylinositol de-N-acetylase [Icmadophila ericetorum]|nr:N-acetylglucosaminyl-phosphatidylinositol de-N-acetylase [Icmadophila ericetorum]